MTEVFKSCTVLDSSLSLSHQSRLTWEFPQPQVNLWGNSHRMRRPTEPENSVSSPKCAFFLIFIVQSTLSVSTVLRDESKLYFYTYELNGDNGELYYSYN